MNIEQIISKRRAVKKYDTDYQIPESDFKKLMMQSMQAPSSFNIQHWRFVDVQDKDSREQIRAAAWDQAQVTEASKILVLCADVKAWEKEPAQYWNKAPQEVSDIMIPMIKDFYDGRDWIQRDEALRSVGIIAESLMLNATAMGFDTCPMIGFDQDAVSKVINLPDDHIIGMMIALGKRREEPFPHGGRIPLEQAVITDKF
ncbi:MAG: nitroreductase family protein [Pseudomonadota bacterium]